MVSPSDIAKYFDFLTPYVNWIILFITPIYIAIGGFFSYLSLNFISILPTNSYIVSFIVMGVIIVLGIIFGVKNNSNG
ncbi:MAG: hypothetical protein ACTSVU_08150 [Promethearchaeota archaeon]